MKIYMSVAIAIASFAVAACAREEASEAPAATTTTEQPGAESPSDVSPVNAQTWVDDVTIGSELGPDGTIVAGRTGDDFAPGQPVHIAMEVGDAPAGSEVMVKWVGDEKVNQQQFQIVQQRNAAG
jgi:hypothetical protein